MTTALDAPGRDLAFAYMGRRYLVGLIRSGRYWVATAAEWDGERYRDTGRVTSLYSQPERAASTMVATLVRSVELDIEAEERQSRKEGRRAYHRINR